MENRPGKYARPIRIFQTRDFRTLGKCYRLLFENVDIMRAFRERTQLIAAPHFLSTKLLLRMRREDRATTLACMDQPQVLRPVFSRVCEDALAITCHDDIDSRAGRSLDRTRLPARATAVDDRAACTVVFTNCCNSIARATGSGFYLRRAHEER